MNNPQYVKVDNTLYKINTDFRVALECHKIATDTTIEDYERALALIYKLFGDEGLNCKNTNKLLELGMKYLTLDKEDTKNDSNSKFELDIFKCEGLIRSSFKFDYNYDPYELSYLHWYDFNNDLHNLSTSEFGTCCVLNRVIGTLNIDTSKIKDSKERANIINAQKELRKKYCVSKKVEMTQEEKESVVGLYKQLGLWKGGQDG